MPQRGRPPQPGTAEEKAAIRREKVRLYVKAHRERKKNAESSSSSASPSSQLSKSSSPPSDADSASQKRDSGGAKHTKIKIEQTPDDDSEQSNPPTDEVRDQQLVKRTTSPSKAARFTITAPPKGNKELANALLGTFRGQFLPNFVRVPSEIEYGSELVTPCSAWITNAYSIAVTHDSSALKSCLLAVGLSLTSMQQQNEGLRMASLDVYHRGLRQVRNDLKPLMTGEATNYLIPYLSCLAAAMFEMVHDGFSENIMQHVKGATSLMELIPKDAKVNHLLNDLLLEDLCMWEIVFALKYRYPSPLRAIRQKKGTRNYKIDGDITASSRNATILGDLLDCADEISSIMASIDMWKSMPASALKQNGLEAEIDKLTGILRAFNAWESRFQIRFGPIHVQTGLDEFTGLPVLQFRSYEVAAAWVYYLTFHLCALETQIEAISEFESMHVTLKNEGHVQQKGSASQPSPEALSNILLDSLNPTFETTYHDMNTEVKGVSQESLSGQLDHLRAKLRIIISQLMDAMCIFLPIPKGIIGSSLVLFPLDRAKTTLKREIARLHKDQSKVRFETSENDSDVMSSLTDMFQSMSVHESLELALAQFGMPPMPEDPDPS